MSQFGDLFKEFMNSAGVKPAQLAQLTNISIHTIHNWLKGRVKKPHLWQDIVAIAAVLHLSAEDATYLLKSANYPSIAELTLEFCEFTPSNLARFNMCKTTTAPRSTYEPDGCR